MYPYRSTHVLGAIACVVAIAAITAAPSSRAAMPASPVTGGLAYSSSQVVAVGLCVTTACAQVQGREQCITTFTTSRIYKDAAGTPAAMTQDLRVITATGSSLDFSQRLLPGKSYLLFLRPHADGIHYIAHLGDTFLFEVHPDGQLLTVAGTAISDYSDGVIHTATMPSDSTSSKPSSTLTRWDGTIVENPAVEIPTRQNRATPLTCDRFIEAIADTK